MIKYDDDLDAFVLKFEDIIFSWQEEPKGDYKARVSVVADNYKSNISKIIEFMYDDIQDMYGDFSVDEIKEKLGKPIIDIDNGQVIYCDQAFDDIHIFSFEFLDEKFNEMQYFSIDG